MVRPKFEMSFNIIEEPSENKEEIGQLKERVSLLYNSIAKKWEITYYHDEKKIVFLEEKENYLEGLKKFVETVEGILKEIKQNYEIGG